MKGGRPGMELMSINGRPVSEFLPGELPQEATEKAEFHNSAGEVLDVEDVRIFSENYSNVSLWALGGMFAILGSAVLLRRPDLRSARWFGLFTGSSAVALAVGPAAGGGHQWALVVQFLSLVGIGASCLPFVAALVGSPITSRRVPVSMVFGVLGVVLIAGYAGSVIRIPALYELVRPALVLYLSASIIVAVGLLAVTARWQRAGLTHRQSRMALWGIALGTLPLLSLTVIPLVLADDPLVPEEHTILAVVLVPAAFAYAILQHQMLGIRRLVHRGMVYGGVTFVLLGLYATGLGVLTTALPNSQDDVGTILATAILLAAGVTVFFPLRRGVRWLVDNVVYGGVVDYETFLDVVETNLIVSGRISEVATSITARLTHALRLESALMFLGGDPVNSRLVAATGERSSDVYNELVPHLEPFIKDSENQDMAEFQWEADSFVLAHLRLSGQYLGYLLLGPKHAGDVFIDDEKHLVASITPILALAVDKSLLSDDLRELNQKLIKAQEAERARIASDLHDGPLQKAMILAGVRMSDPRQRDDVSQQMILELREICSRLRPAILDDLGIVPALEWLVDGVSRNTGLETRLTIHNVSDDDRFTPDIELALFRVTQEAANNVVKYARSTSVDVSLKKEDNRLELRVMDNGDGFVVTARGDKGSGISGMRERIVQLDGSFEIDSVPTFGTTVIARIPLG